MVLELELMVSFNFAMTEIVLWYCVKLVLV